MIVQDTFHQTEEPQNGLVYINTNTMQLLIIFQRLPQIIHLINIEYEYHMLIYLCGNELNNYCILMRVMIHIKIYPPYKWEIEMIRKREFNKDNG